jgi:hypothetical protein
MKLAPVLFAALTVFSVGVRAEVDFAKDIQPVIEKSCIKCHSGPKAKGGLSLETRANMLKGGNEGPAVVAGKAAESFLFKVITAPKTDDTRMPPDGEPLPKATTDLVKAWIDEGAKWPDSIVIAGPKKEATKASVDEAGLPISPAEKAAVEKLEKAGVFVMRLAQNTNWLRVDFTYRGKDVKDEELLLLKDCPNLVELNFGGLNFTDAQAVHLKPLTNLTRLQLHRTKVTDAALANLAGHAKLASLNLYETAVTDAGLEALKGSKNLKKLYVWQTKVTENGAKQLAIALPGIDINRGYELPPEPKKDEPKKEEPKKVEPKKEEPKKEEPKKKAPPKKKEPAPPPKEEPKKP